MKSILFFLFLFLTSIYFSLGQHQNVIIGDPLAWGLPSEPTVCINPANPDEILVGAMGDNYYISYNGGNSWTHGVLQSSWGVNADPVVLVDQHGRFFYLHLPDVINKVVCHRIDNLGASWSEVSNIAFNGTHDVDKEWATYDPVNDRIYLSWTYFDTWGSTNPNDSSCIYMSWTADGGQTWNDPVRISDQRGNATGGSYSMHGSYPTTGPDGEVYVTWWGPGGLMFDRSLDAGITWLQEDINITNEHNDWLYSIPGVQQGVSFPVISCDRSGGQNNGDIYICWADKRNGYYDLDVFVVKSTDRGLTWSDPIRVNDDPPGTHQFFPFLTVDQVTGKVWLVFFDRRNHTDANTDVYMAVSEDGGLTFSNFKVSESSFLPYNSVFFGHYIALAAYDDHIIPVWNRMDDGEGTLMGAIIDPSVVGIDDIIEQPVSELMNSPNPFTESSFVSFKVRRSTVLSLYVYDLSGKIVATVFENKVFDTGKHVEKVDAQTYGIKPGAYLIILETESERITTKAMYVER